MTTDLPLDDFRYFLKDEVRLTVDFRKTDQSRGVPPPAVEKEVAAGKKRFDLPGPSDWKNIKPITLIDAMRARKSHRVYTQEPMTIEDLGFLLWATQGIRSLVNAGTALRTVPSAGARHPFETYLCVSNVTGLPQGLHRYLPIDHQVVLERTIPDIRNRIINATYGQSFVGKAPVSFIWTAIPYRTEWRYGNAAHKVIALDAGHVCQNLYLAVEAVGAGTCAVGAYHQEEMDNLLGVDGKDEFTVYLAPVGKI